MTNGRVIACTLILVGLLNAQSGCADATKKIQPTWHQRFSWDAKDYFDDPKVITLCHAIEANDIKEIDRLIAAGADVNAKGKENMTPLMWAYPDNKLERFKRLLEHGADPNVIVKSDFDSHGGISLGDAVTHMACRTKFLGYFEAVFTHGGDPNLSSKARFKESPLIIVITGGAPHKIDKVKSLVSKGANLNQPSGTGLTPAMTAVGWGGQYDVALCLLESGADHRVYTNDNMRLIHIVLAEEQRRGRMWTEEKKNQFKQLVDWLVQHGESVEQAAADRARWKSWSQTTGEYQRKLAAEIAARKAKEGQEKAATDTPAE